jgi:tetratricopeptide (TPR) repeat protein
VRYFERAIARDTAYAQAYAGLADAWVLYPTYGVGAPRDAYPRARAAAERALALDSTLGNAHAALAIVREKYEWDWRGAERELQRAIALDPGYATAHQWYAEYLSLVGRVEEALAEADRAVALDPLSPIIRVDRASALIRGRRYDAAIDELRRTIQTDPDFGPAHNILGWAYLANGMMAEAVTELRTALRITEGRNGMGRLAQAYGLTGQLDSALAVIGRLAERSRREYVPPYTIALGYAGLGDVDRALDWLERSAEVRDSNIALYLLTDPLLDRLRPDPRFKRLLRRVGLG